MDIGAIGLIINYLVFAGLFTYRYLKPLEWGEWMIETGREYINLIAAVSFLLIIMVLPLKVDFDISVFSYDLVSGLPILIAIAFSIVVLYYRFSSVSAIPLALFLLSFIQELYHTLGDPDHYAFGILLGWYVGSLILIITVGAFLIGPLLFIVFPKEFNQNYVILQDLKRKNPGKEYFEPDQCLAAILIFSLVMIIRALLSLF